MGERGAEQELAELERQLANLEQRSAEDALVREQIDELDRKSTRLNSSHIQKSRMPSSA